MRPSPGSMGPNYYAFDYGPVHFIALDDVIWGGKAPEGSGTYTGGLDAKQLAFLRRDLEEVPEDRLVVLMMHTLSPAWQIERTSIA